MEKHMNGVRQHLLPSYSQQHLRHVQYIKRCGRCTEDIVVEAAWAAGGHEARTCESRSQPRGLSFVSWARLFLKIFPDEIRVPSPCRSQPILDLNSWLTSTAQIATTHATFQTSLSLGYKRTFGWTRPSSHLPPRLQQLGMLETIHLQVQMSHILVVMLHA
jgi:hypothetical protein